MEYRPKRKKRLSIMRRPKHIIPRSCLDELYKSLLRPLLDYFYVNYDSCTIYESERLDKLQRKVSLLCTGAFRITSYEKVLKELCFFCCCCFTSQVNSYCHGGTVSSPNHTFFLGKLEQAVLRAHTFACN